MEVVTLPGLCDLSDGQMLNWYVEGLENGSNLASVSNNITAAFELTGTVSYERLRNSLEAVITETTLAKIAVDEFKGKPFQYLVEPSELNFEYTEISEEEDINLNLVSFSLSEFDIRKGNLLKFKLIKKSDDLFVFAFCIHHLISDGISIKLLLKDVSAHYNGKVKNIRAIPSYIEFCENQKSSIESGAYLSQLNFWHGLLRERSFDLELNMSKLPQPKEALFAGRSKSFIIARPQFLTLKKVSKQHQLSVVELLFYLYSSLIYKFTGKNEFLVGFLTSGRSQENRRFLRTLGSLFNILPIPVSFEPSLSVLDQLIQNQKTFKACQQNSTIPYNYLTQELAQKGVNILGHINAVFSFEKAVHNELNLEGVSSEYFHIQRRYTQNDLVLHTHEYNDEIICTFDYRETVFDAHVIDSFIKHFQELIGDIERTLSSSLNKLPACSDDVLKITQWNNTDHNYGKVCLVESYLQSVEQYANKVALVDDYSCLTYREVHQKALNLAHQINKVVDDEQRIIGVCLPRSPDFVVSLFAIWLSRRAFLPIDPDLPEERQQYMLQTAGCNTLVSSPSFFSEALNCQLIDTTSLPYRDHLSDLRPQIIADMPAYVLFTSGSTGKPKGVQVPHGALANRLLWKQRKYPIGEQNTILHKTPMTFDVSIWELIWPLLHGAKMFVSCPQGHKDVEYIERVIERYQVDTLHFVPSMLEVFLRSRRGGNVDSVKTIFCSGEALSRSLVLQAKGVFKKGELVNLYGPTEAAIDVTYFNCSELEDRLNVPIGLPIDNTSLFILDANLQLSPVGAVGELYIGGANLADGYINNSTLTNKAFFPVEIQGESQRLYKTGDLCRYDEDGQILYMGRTDHQVKLRGQRIELSEISNSANELDAVESTLVLLEPAKKSALLCFILTSDTTLRKEHVKAHLENHLPSYMIPQHIHVLSEFPTTINGKVDRAQLIHSFFASSKPKLESKKEKHIVELVLSNVLGYDIHGDLDLSPDQVGLNSLLINVFLKQLEDKSGVRLSQKDVVACSTLTALCRLVDELAGSTSKIHATSKVQLDHFYSAPSQELLDQELARLAEKYEIPAVAASVHYNGKDYHSVHGSLAIDSNIPLSLNSQFRVGCIAKTMTAALVLKYCEQGLLDLDEPIINKWPRFAVKDTYTTQNVTLRHFLLHTSGIDDAFFIPSMPLEFKSLTEFEQALTYCPSLFELDSYVVYSSLGYIIIAYYLELIFEDSFTNLLEQELFEVIDVQDYSLPPFEYANVESAQGYIFEGSGLRSVTVDNLISNCTLMPAIGDSLLMSSQNLLKFAKSFLISSNSRILSPTSVVTQLGQHRIIKGDHGFANVGMGVFHGQGGAVGLKGNGLGHQSFFNVIESQNMAIALMGNIHPTEPMYEEFYEFVSGLKYINRNGQEIEQFSQSSLVGCYQNANCTISVKETENNNLMFSVRYTDKEPFVSNKVQESGSGSYLVSYDNTNKNVFFFYGDEQGTPHFISFGSEILHRVQGL